MSSARDAFDSPLKCFDGIGELLLELIDPGDCLYEFFPERDRLAAERPYLGSEVFTSSGGY